MSRTHGHGTGDARNGRKHPGYEYWSRRPGPIAPGKSSKHFCHKIERAREQREIERVVVEISA